MLREWAKRKGYMLYEWAKLMHDEKSFIRMGRWSWEGRG
jgi:hypothetical protein